MQALTHFRHVAIIAAVITLAGCTPPSDEAFLNHGEPASLLETSTEAQTIDIATTRGVDSLAHLLDQDRPTRAELNCTSSEAGCSEAKKILEREGINVVMGDTVNNTVTLVYDRIIAHDCDARFKNNTPNHYNTNYPGFGCSVASNMVREVADKRQFVNPATTDLPNAKHAVDDITHAYKPRPIVAPYGVTQSLTSQ